MVASYAGHIDCVRELVLQGADINLQREVGQVYAWIRMTQVAETQNFYSCDLVRKTRVIIAFFLHGIEA